MPLYVYRIIRPDDSGEEETFEILQSINAEPLKVHPVTQEPVERVITAPSISAGKLGNTALTDAGMTKYVKTSDGTYERQAGSAGPKVINPRDL